MIQACIFDFDGVLADTEELHYRSFQSVLTPFEAGFPWEDYVKGYMAFDSAQVFALALKKAGVESHPSVDKLVSKKNAAFASIVENVEVQPLPGATAAVRFAADRGPVALCTGAARSDVVPLLNAFDLLSAFQAIITADDVEISKPDPACYRLAVDLLDRPAQSCLAIEDTPGGLTAAKGAGCQTLALTTTHSREQVTPYADRVMDSLEDFPDYFRGG